MASLKDLAIQAALNNNWQEACTLNLQILEEKEHDIDSLNRLAFAYLKLNQFSDAKKTYNQVLNIDATNPIASKNIKKIDTLSKQKPNNSSKSLAHASEDSYIEETGKTKTIELTNLADKKTLLLVQPGDQVSILPKRSKIFIQTEDKKYIGMLPDSVGMRLTSLIKGGNEYTAFVKAIGDKTVTVFIRETKRATRFKNQPSFSII
jgi:tetratricopeptide (TPR) repeat protein